MAAARAAVGVWVVATEVGLVREAEATVGAAVTVLGSAVAAVAATAVVWEEKEQVRKYAFQRIRRICPDLFCSTHLCSQKTRRSM